MGAESHEGGRRYREERRGLRSTVFAAGLVAGAIFVALSQKAPPVPKAGAWGTPMTPVSRKADPPPQAPVPAVATVTEKEEPEPPVSTEEAEPPVEQPELPPGPFELDKEVVRMVYDEQRQKLIPARIMYDGTGVSINGEHYTYKWGGVALSVLSIEEPEVGGNVTTTAKWLWRKPQKSTLTAEELRNLCHSLMFGERKATLEADGKTITVKLDRASEESGVEVTEEMELVEEKK